MKSASSTASGSGQQREKRPVTDTELQTGDPSEMALVKAQSYPEGMRAGHQQQMRSRTFQERHDGWIKNSENREKLAKYKS